MSVTIQPSKSLGFDRTSFLLPLDPSPTLPFSCTLPPKVPLTQNVKRSLNITNPNVDPVSFKIKTTAPRLYAVWPNSGKVDRGQTVEVQVMLRAMKEEPPLNAKCRDKFLIQSMLIPPEKTAIPLHDLVGSFLHGPASGLLSLVERTATLLYRACIREIGEMSIEDQDRIRP